MTAIRYYPLLFFVAAALALLSRESVSGVVACPHHLHPYYFFQHEDSECPSCGRAVIPQLQHYAKWNESSLALLKKLAAKPQNHIFSPQSFFEIVTLLGAGAEGKTQEQTLGIAGATAGTFQEFSQIAKSGSVAGGGFVSRANALVVSNKKQLQPDFKMFLNQYDEKIVIKEEVDFSSQQALSEVSRLVNNMACDVTQGMITECFDPSNGVDESTLLAIANASYFKGTWLNDFKVTKEEFRPLDAQPASVKMIESVNNDLSYARHLDWVAVSIPYKENAQMVIIIPPEGVPPASISPDTFHTLTSQLKKQFVNLKIPEYLIEMEYALEDYFGDDELGVFAPNAAFGGMVKNPPFSIDTIRHKAKIEVDQVGSRAASFTLAIGRESHPVELPPEVIADHPFLFFISDKTKECPARFMGQVWNPANAISAQ